MLTRFGIDNLSQFLDGNENIMFPDGALEALFGIAFNHMRAIIAKNVSGSKFQNIIVPVIIPRDLFPELLKINIEKFNQFKEAVGLEEEEMTGIPDFNIKEKKSKGKPEEKINFESVAVAPTRDAEITKEQTKKMDELKKKMDKIVQRGVLENAKKELKNKK